MAPETGWTGPDERGHIRYTVKGPRNLSVKAPERDGYEPFFVAVHGLAYTVWTYRKVATR